MCLKSSDPWANNRNGGGPDSALSENTSKTKFKTIQWTL